MRLHDCLDYWGREQPEVEFAVRAARSLAYGAAILAANRLANAFIAAGLAPGDRVAVLAKNSAARCTLYG
jgi:acyl-CoA synthetase (AMP-forming)/AMP-acid ligase II